jgi:hypothetical protein
MTDRVKLLADTLACLKGGYHIEHVGTLRGAAVVADAWPHSAYYYTVNDNGGEFHVHKVNSSSPGRSVAYEGIGGTADAGTMAYRVQCVMRGLKIDWNIRFDAEEIEIMRKAA